MFVVTANGASLESNSLEELDASLTKIENIQSLELSISVVVGPSLTMLRSEEHAFLMYLRESGDSGFVSGRSVPVTATTRFRFGNGQLDEYPIAWCIPVEDCFKAVLFFYVNAGLQPEWVTWHES